MADELTPQEKQEAINLLREEKKDLATSIGLMKKRNAAMAGVIDVEKVIKKDRRTLSTDISNQVESVQESMMGGVEGFVTETFGPLGGFINLFTMGFVRRRMANAKLEKENVKETEKANKKYLDVLADRALGAEGITKAETSNFEELKEAKIEEIKTTQSETEIQQAGLKLKQEREDAAAFAEGRQIETIEDETSDLGGGAGGEGGAGGAGGTTNLDTIAQLLREGFGLNTPPYLQTIAEKSGGEATGGEGESFSETLSSIEENTQKTSKGIAGQQETKREEEREEDREHKELIDTLKGMGKGGKGGKPKVDDDGGFFAGLSIIAGTLGGIALGLAAGTWIPPVKELSKILNVFDTKFPKWTKGIKNFFNIADDLPKVPSIADDIAKTTSKFDNWKAALRAVTKTADGQIVTQTKHMKKIADAGGLATDAGKTTKAARTLFGIKVPGMFASVGDKIADVGKQLDGAKDIIKTKGLAKGLTSIAGKATMSVVGGTLGRAFRIAGSPVFDVAAMGKDMYDIASATMDDDIRTEWKKEDVGAIIGGVVGGALGMAIGMPWLGVGLGNMAGEFIGAALDQPDVIKGIETAKENVEAELAPVRARLKETQTLIEAETAKRAQLEVALQDAKTKGDAALTARIESQIARSVKEKNILTELQMQDEEREESLNNELISIKTLQPKVDAVQASANAVNALYQQRNETEDKIEKARSEGNAAAVKLYQDMLVGIEEDITKGEADYEKQKEELRDLSQKTSKRVSDKTTNVLDRLASFDDGVAGFFGGILEGLGLAEGLTGEAKQTLLLGEAQEEKKELENRLLELESMKVNEHLRAGPGSASHKKAMIALTKKQLDEQQKIIDAQESGAAQEKRIAEIDKEIADHKKEIAAGDLRTGFMNKDKREDVVKKLEAERAENQKIVDASKKGGVVVSIDPNAKDADLGQGQGGEETTLVSQTGGEATPQVAKAMSKSVEIPTDTHQMKGDSVVVDATTGKPVHGEDEGGEKSMAEKRSDGTYGPQLSPKEARLKERKDKKAEKDAAHDKRIKTAATKKRLRSWLFDEMYAEEKKVKGKNIMKIQDISSALSGGGDVFSLPNSILRGFWDSEAQTPKAARGGIVTKPAYLGSSGVVVGEHPTWSGKGAFGGGLSAVPDRPGMGEAIIPLDGQRGGTLMAKALAPAIAGTILNELAMATIGAAGPAGMGSPPIITDSSTTVVNNNNTTITPPQTRGQILPGQGRDHGVSHFTHAA